MQGLLKIVEWLDPYNKLNNMYCVFMFMLRPIRKLGGK